MKPGDFVDIHAPDGCLIGEFVSDDGETITAKIGDIVWEGIPKRIVTMFVPITVT